jgi:hypothetical protein
MHFSFFNALFLEKFSENFSQEFPNLFLKQLSTQQQSNKTETLQMLKKFKGIISLTSKIICKRMLLSMLKQHALISSKHTIRQYSSLIVEKWPTSKVRQTFIDYFCIENQHKFVESSSVIPPKGSGTYFTNAGMNQFKSIILGECKSYELFDFQKYKGLANSQKCIRIGENTNGICIA